MPRDLARKPFLQELSNDIEDSLGVEQALSDIHLAGGPTEIEEDRSAESSLTTTRGGCLVEMPRTIRELLSDSNASQPRYVRLHNANYTSRELLNEILSMANRIVRRISGAQLSSTDRRMWPVREVAGKWDSIRAYPEMLQEVDTELLKILVLDAYADMERLERAG